MYTRHHWEPEAAMITKFTECFPLARHFACIFSFNPYHSPGFIDTGTIPIFQMNTGIGLQRWNNSEKFLMLKEISI